MTFSLLAIAQISAESRDWRLSMQQPPLFLHISARAETGAKGGNSWLTCEGVYKDVHD